MIEEHLRHVSDNSDLPIIVFQFPLVSGLSYPLSTLVGSASSSRPFWPSRTRSATGIGMNAKSASFTHLTIHSAWFLGSLVLGSDGLLSGAGSVIADLQVTLFRAVQAGDLKAAKAINDRIYPTVRAFHDEPLLDTHNRMKEALVLLGRIPEAHVRPPLRS